MLDASLIFYFGKICFSGSVHLTLLVTVDFSDAEMVSEKTLSDIHVT